MEMFYLVLSLYQDALIIVPEKYTLEQCDKAGKSFEAYGRRYNCVLAPTAEYCKFKYVSHVQSNGAMSYSVTEKVCE